MRTGTAVAATLLLLLPLASAGGAVPAASLVAHRVEARDGVLEGLLVGAVWMTPKSQQVLDAAKGLTGSPQNLANATFLQEFGAAAVATQPEVRSPAGIQVPRLRVEAGSATLSRYEVDRTTYADHPDPEHPDPRSGPEPVEVVELTGFGIDAHGEGDDESASIRVLPLEGVAAAARSSGDLVATGRAAATDDSFGSSVSAYATPTFPATLLVTPRADGQVQVTGSFRIVIQAIDIPYRSDQGGAVLETRRQSAEVAPGSGIPHPVVIYGGTTVGTWSKVREAIIDVADATLVLDGADLLVQEALLTASAVQLEGSRGHVGAEAVEGETVEAKGQLATALAVTKDTQVRADLAGQFVSLSIGGSRVPVPATNVPNAFAPSGDGGLSPLAFLLLAIPLVPAAYWAVTRRRFTRMDQALDQGDFETALRLAGRFTPWPGQRQDSVLAAAICLLGMGRSEEACERLDNGRRWSAARRPMRDFLLARGHAALGEVEAATRALAASLLAEPALIAQARTDPVLTGLLDGKRDPKSTRQEAYA